MGMEVGVLDLWGAGVAMRSPLCAGDGGGGPMG